MDGNDMCSNTSVLSVLFPDEEGDEVGDAAVVDLQRVLCSTLNTNLTYFVNELLNSVEGLREYVETVSWLDIFKAIGQYLSKER